MSDLPAWAIAAARDAIAGQDTHESLSRIGVQQMIFLVVLIVVGLFLWLTREGNDGGHHGRL